jgi:hypothetical protein
LKKYAEQVLENQRLLALDISLMETSPRWWGVHKETIQEWYQCKQILRIRFGAEHGSNTVHKYDGCCASFVALVRKMEVLASLVGFAKQDSCKEKG